MNIQTDSKPVVRPSLALEYRPRALPRIGSAIEERPPEGEIVPAYAEPSAKVAYGCVDWFRYDKHESPLEEPSGSRRKQ